MHIYNTYLSVASTMKAQKLHVCTPKLYAVRNCATSAVTKASTRTSKKDIPKIYGGGREDDFSQKLGILNTKLTQQ